MPTTRNVQWSSMKLKQDVGRAVGLESIQANGDSLCLTSSSKCHSHPSTVQRSLLPITSPSVNPTLPILSPPHSPPSPSSSCTNDSDNERALASLNMQKRKGKQHIPRPPNAFILYRSYWWAQRKNEPSGERDHRQVSRMAAESWNSLPESDRAKFKQFAETVKKQHADENPDYKYTPTARRDIPGGKKGSRNAEHQQAVCKEIASLVMGGMEANQLEKEVSKMFKNANCVEEGSKASSHSHPYRSKSGHSRTSKRQPKKDSTPKPDVISGTSPVLSPFTPTFAYDIPSTDSQPSFGVSLGHSADDGRFTYSTSGPYAVPIANAFKRRFVPPELDPSIVGPMFSYCGPSSLSLTGATYPAPAAPGLGALTPTLQHDGSPTMDFSGTLDILTPPLVSDKPFEQTPLVSTNAFSSGSSLNWEDMVSQHAPVEMSPSSNCLTNLSEFDFSDWLVEDVA